MHSIVYKKSDLEKILVRLVNLFTAMDPTVPRWLNDEKDDLESS